MGKRLYGAKVRYHRERQGLTQRELARQLQSVTGQRAVGQCYVSQIEGGYSTTGRKGLTYLARSFATALDAPRETFLTALDWPE